ncbi:hypothetical protein A6V36_22615 [Paraburkholderia ginsengiterrae]|uniref:Secreted protein n=1 Tax=Paraburkholderia ginsengiterrae TaxID=1462993 RepID=A0ABX2V164_9BURK|nr:hypothetical protein A6V36_22615 [Paraburkholderia ginsengiterrae]
MSAVLLRTLLLLLPFCANRPRFAPFPLPRIGCAAWRVARLAPLCAGAPRYNHLLATTVHCRPFGAFSRALPSARMPGFFLHPSAPTLDQARSAQ